MIWFPMLYKVVPTFQSMVEIQKCRAVLPCGVVYSAVSTRWFSLLSLRIKSSDEIYRAVLFIMVYKVILAFESKDEIFKCDQ